MLDPQTLLQQISQGFPQGAHFLVALSGGLDSCVLLSLLKKLQKKTPHFQLRAIHIHHGLSPNADKWVAFCQQLCANYHIPLLVEYVQVSGEQGIEASARLARYQAIQAQIQPQEYLVTAHHQGDQTETFLLALKRGSGIQGLGAMQAHSSLFGMQIFRPLLNFSRSQLQAYAQAEQLTWVEDESNQDSSYERNFLRNQILPLLRERWAHFDQAVQRSAQHCFEQQQLLEELLKAEYEKIFEKNQRTLSIADFVQRSEPQQRALLRMWLAHHGLTMPSLLQLDQLRQDLIFARTDAQPVFQLGEQYVRRYQQRLYLTPKLADISAFRAPLLLNQPLELPDQLGELILQADGEQWRLQWQEKEYWLPPSDQPLTVAFQYSGKLDLYGKGLRQDIKKIWQKFAIPPWQRQRIPLIFYGEELRLALGVFSVQPQKR